MQATRERIYQTAPLVSMSWRSSGVVLSPDDRLSVEAEELDEHHRRRHYCLWSELDGTIREMPAPAGGEEQVVFSPDPRLGAGGKDPGLGELPTLARRYLGQAAADAWLSLLSPGIGLVHAEPGDPVIAQLGGLLALPINSWPVWPGNGPLSHVLSVDCASLAMLMPGWDMPGSGRLAFFYFDGEHWGPEIPVTGSVAIRNRSSRGPWSGKRNRPSAPCVAPARLPPDPLPTRICADGACSPRSTPTMRRR